MQLQDKQVRAFQKIYQEQFGEDIGMEEAGAMANQFVQLVKAVYKPINKNEYESKTQKS